MSMIGMSLMAIIESGIPSLRPSPTPTYFGNIPAICFAGDLAQLPPVLDRELYSPLPSEILSDEIEPNTQTSRRRIPARQSSLYDHHSHDIWNNCLDSCIFLRKNRRASRCPSLRNLPTPLRYGNMDTRAANLSRSRYVGNPRVKQQFKGILRNAQGSSVELAMMPVLATNSRTVQHTNLRILGAVSQIRNESLIRLSKLFEGLQILIHPSQTALFERHTPFYLVSLHSLRWFSILFLEWPTSAHTTNGWTPALLNTLFSC